MLSMNHSNTICQSNSYLQNQQCSSFEGAHCQHHPAEFPYLRSALKPYMASPLEIEAKQQNFGFKDQGQQLVNINCATVAADS